MRQVGLRLHVAELAAHARCHERGQFVHVFHDARDAQLAQHVGIARRDMARAHERDGLHARRARGVQAREAVLDHEAARRLHAERFGRMQIDIRIRLGPRDHLGAEDALAEDRVEPGAAHRGVHAREAAVRHHGGGQRDLAQRVAHAVDRAHRIGDRDFAVVVDRLEKMLGQREVEALGDVGEKARGLLAEGGGHGGAEIHAGEGAAERIEEHVVGDDFAVDEHAVAVADEMVDHA
ncbi:hypothetical protein PT2222_270026 [Paraburkholderia tropica]